MDRKTRGKFAGAVAALGVVLSVGCGVDNVSPSMESRTDPAPARTAAAFVSGGGESTTAQAALGPQRTAAQVVEVVNSPSFESEPAGESRPIDSGEPSEGPSSEAVPQTADTSDAEESEPTSEADQGAPQIAEVELQGAPAALENKPQAQSEIKFALPSAGEPEVAKPADDATPMGGTPRNTTIELAIRPGDAAPLSPSGHESAEHPESRPVEPAPANSDLAPLVATRCENPQGVNVEPESTIAQGPGVEARPARQPLAQAPPQAAAPQAAMAPVRASRSPAMVATLARADERVRHGVQLAEKGALYAARKEFTAAIQLIAQAHDLERGTREYSRSAVAGFQALKEANEFFKAAAGETETARLVAPHKTPILKGAELLDMPPSIAAQYYYAYAKEQLAAGVGQESVASIALYGLGKVIIAGAGANSQQLEYTGPAMALYQAALIAQPQNFRAAHELGVLLAGAGQLELARAMLMGSASAAQQPVVWRNLATVHSRMGEQQLAQQAQQNADALQATSPESNAPPVQWVDPATFARTVPANDSLIPPAAPAAQSTIQTNPAKAPPEPTQTPANVARKRTTQWNPLNLRR